MNDTFYITTTLPYVNADPHLGFALEIVHADILARHQADLGKEVFFNTGTDEHGVKIYRKAQEQGKDTQAYVDEYAEKFSRLKDRLNLFSDLHFIRTTDSHHKAAAQEFWQRCLKNGDIYKKAYQIKYCVGCELEKTDSELVDGKCPIHPNLELEIIDEENYFFKFSKYQNQLFEFYQSNPNFVVPDFRFNEIKKFVEAGLADFSISRLKEKMPWGVAVPDDEAQVMYVWFDALINYVSTLGWPDDVADFEKFWPGVQIAGKDNLRQQSAMWQAMLMSAGLPNSKQIIIHGFITSGGQKMSKSLGNVIDPYEIVDKYGVDALRYWLAREMNTFEDGDFTWERFKEAYTANLVNGLGNLVSRTLKMAISYEVPFPKPATEDFLVEEYNQLLSEYRIQEAAELVWKEIRWCDQEIQKWEPFKLIKTDPEKAKEVVHGILVNLHKIAYMLNPILPETSEKISRALENPSLEDIPHLFPRLE